MIKVKAYEWAAANVAKLHLVIGKNWDFVKLTKVKQIKHTKND